MATLLRAQSEYLLRSGFSSVRLQPIFTTVGIGLLKNKSALVQPQIKLRYHVVDNRDSS